MIEDLNLAILNATFKIEQTQQKGNIIAGTMWMVRVCGEGESAKIALVTAYHVLDMMKEPLATIMWRRLDENGKWQKEALQIQIRDRDLKQMWLTHPERDIAVMWIEPPPYAREYAIDFNMLADEKNIKKYNLGLGDELLSLGYPKGLPANGLGFPILRSGRVASYPIWPVRDYPSFLMDLTIFPGNSGGPVYVIEKFTKRGAIEDNSPQSFVAGLIAKQVSLNDESLEIGVVIHASFIRDLLVELLEDEHDDNFV